MVKSKNKYNPFAMFCKEVTSLIGLSS